MMRANAPKLASFPLTGAKFRSKYKGTGDCRENDIKCNEKTRRRSYDGTCNNLHHPHWGKAGSSYLRLIHPAYQDGVNSLRGKKSGTGELQSPRIISNIFGESQNISDEVEDSKHTLALTLWGQFVDHDLTSTPLANTGGISCCNGRKMLPKGHAHKNCISIYVHPKDHYFGQFNVECIPMVRSAPAIRPDCKLGPREQLNMVTSYLDGSQVYGSDRNTGQRLRAGVGGRLKIMVPDLGSYSKNESFPPPENPGCEKVLPSCRFDAGDVRASENMHLAILHTLFVREHNRIADELLRMNPSWRDDTVYHEARRINIAQLQHITYNEFLPILLGKRYMKFQNLLPRAKGNYTDLYDTSMDATVLNVFASAAFRFGHSMMPWDFCLANVRTGVLENYVYLKRTFFNLKGVFKHFDEFLMGMTKQLSRKMDRFFTATMSRELFGSKKGWGLDLNAVNIQRGRDHGLPGYDAWVNLCSGATIKIWEDLKNRIPEQSVEILERLYSFPDEIDLYVGALAEKTEKGSILGKTLACIIGNQFIRLRKGDRFFYEEKGGGFSLRQVNTLRKVSLARIICDNSIEIKSMQPLVMKRVTDTTNQVVSCSSSNIPKLDLSPWKAKT